MLSTRLALAAALVGAAAAQFQILSPSTNVWWVAGSQNTLTWNCKDPSAPATFTVLVGNKDPKILTAPIAIIGIQNNFDCSKLITQDQLTAPAGTGYTVLFANTLNQTDIYLTSDVFEIKALGSAYPTSTPSLSSSGGPSPTGTAANATTSGTSGSGALGLAPSVVGGVVLGALGAVVGLVGF